MLQAHDERVVQLLADALLVADHILLLVLLDELLGYGLQSVELAVEQAPHEVDLAEPADGQAFHYPVLLERLDLLVPMVHQALEVHLPVENPVLYGYSVVEQAVLVRRLEPDHPGGFLGSGLWLLRKQELVDRLVEYLLDIGRLDVERQRDSDLRPLIVQGDLDGVVDETGDGGSGRVQGGEVIDGPIDVETSVLGEDFAAAGAVQAHSILS